MPLAHPRGIAILASPEEPKSTANLPFKTFGNAASSVRSKRSSWLHKIPGVRWIKEVIGRRMNPTHGMTEEQAREWTRAQWAKHKLEKLQRKRIVEFKAAKYMALWHPDFYWHKYILPFPPGSEKRKRAVFLFILVNHEERGDYYGRLWHPELLEEEFKEMGIDPANKNIIREYSSKFRRADNKASEDEIFQKGKRSLSKGFVPYLSNTDKRLLSEVRREVEGVDNSSAKVARRRDMPNPLSVREYRVRGEDTPEMDI